MSWLRMDDRFASNGKIVQLTDKEFRVWVRLLCHCAHVKDPTVDAVVQREVPGLTRALVRRFVALDLLDVAGEAVEIHDWVKYLPRDATNAERQARWRARKHQHNRDAAVTPNPDSAVTPAVTEPVTPAGISPSRARSRARAAEPVPVPKEQDQDQTLSPSSENSTAVKEVFWYWREVRNHPNAKLGAERSRLIKARLKDGFSVDQLKRAIDGVALDPWDERDRHDDIKILFRNGSQVEKFLELHDRPAMLPAVIGPAQRRYGRGLTTAEMLNQAREAAS